MHQAPDTPPAWHTLPADETRQILQSGPNGLSETEARRRFGIHGPNQLQQQRRRSAWMRMLLQFHNILLYVMLGSAAITALLGHWVDTAVLLGAVVINAIIGFIQESKAENALDAIRAMLSQRATVIRDGRKQEIDAALLVPGDLVLLASGDRVPADLRLASVRELRIEEAALTGESLAVEKSHTESGVDAPLGDRFGMAYSGTVVVFGQGSGLVVATGDQTELGKINHMLAGIGRAARAAGVAVERVAHVVASQRASGQHLGIGGLLGGADGDHRGERGGHQRHADDAAERGGGNGCGHGASCADRRGPLLTYGRGDGARSSRPRAATRAPRAPVRDRR